MSATDVWIYQLFDIANKLISNRLTYILQKINGLTNAASATPVSGAQGTPNLWGGQYDPIVSQLNGYDEALLRQELLKQYSQLSLASTPGLTSNLLNQLQAQQHAQQQHAAASPSPALPSFPNYDATNILASRLNQLRLSQQLGNPATSTGYQTNPTESLSNGLNGYDRLIPQVRSITWSGLNDWATYFILSLTVEPSSLSIYSDRLCLLEVVVYIE